MSSCRIASERTHRLDLHHVRLPVDDVSPPGGLADSLWPSRIDGGEGDSQLSKDFAMVIRHRVVAGDKHPGIRLQSLGERSKERLVVQSVKRQLRECDGSSPASFQLRRDPVVDVSIDDEPQRLGQSCSGRLLVRLNDPPPRDGVVDLRIAHVVAFPQLLSAAWTRSQLRR